MNWVFILIAFTHQGAIVERVYLDNQSMCVAYAQGYISREAIRDARIQVAQCLNLRSGEVISVAKTQRHPESWQNVFLAGSGGVLHLPRSTQNTLRKIPCRITPSE